MRNITRASVALVAAVALTGVTAMSASAAIENDATFEVEAQGLSISTSTTEDIALETTDTFLSPGSTLTGTIADIVVEDLRASETAWNATVSVTDFTTLPDVNSEFEVIEADALTYTASDTAATGLSTAATTAAGFDFGAADTDVTVQQATVVAGNNTVTWNADLSLVVPDQAIAGTYSATLTHSVL